MGPARPLLALQRVFWPSVSLASRCSASLTTRPPLRVVRVVSDRETDGWRGDAMREAGGRGRWCWDVMGDGKGRVRRAGMVRARREKMVGAEGLKDEERLVEVGVVFWTGQWSRGVLEQRLFEPCWISIQRSRCWFAGEAPPGRCVFSSRSPATTSLLAAQPIAGDVRGRRFSLPARKESSLSRLFVLGVFPTRCD